MDNLEGDEYSHYWETKMFLETQDLDSWGLDEALASYSSSSPEGSNSSATSSMGGGGSSSIGVRAMSRVEEGSAASASAASGGAMAKNIIMERNRRKRLNERLYALRSVVPTITKMDKASIIKDAIDYIEQLQQQERTMMAEISEIEVSAAAAGGCYHSPVPLQDHKPAVAALVSSPMRSPNKRRHEENVTPLSAPAASSSHYPFHQAAAAAAAKHSPLQLVEMKVSPVEDRTWLVSLTCNKEKHTILGLCQVFQSLNLKTLSSNITSLSDKVLHTLLVESDEMGSDRLREQIHRAISAQQQQQQQQQLIPHNAAASSCSQAGPMSCC